MLALQETRGYIEFSLAPPRVGKDGIRQFEIMTVTFNPTQISTDALARISADASGLEVKVIEQ